MDRAKVRRTQLISVIRADTGSTINVRLAPGSSRSGIIAVKDRL